MVVSPDLNNGAHWERYYSDPAHLIRDTAVELEGVVTKDEASLFEQ